MADKYTIVVRPETHDEKLVRNMGRFAGYDGRQIEFSDKKRWVCILLWLFLGLFGAHRFYVGKWKSGLAMLLLCWCIGGVGLVWLIDGVKIWTMIFEDSDGACVC